MSLSQGAFWLCIAGAVISALWIRYQLRKRHIQLTQGTSHFTADRRTAELHRCHDGLVMQEWKRRVALPNRWRVRNKGTIKRHTTINKERFL